MKKYIVTADPCPKCRHDIYAIQWGLIKKISARICSNDDCDFEETADELHERLLTV